MHPLPRPSSISQGAVADLCFVPAPSAAAAAAEQPGVQLYSLSADGALLLWGPLPLPLIELFSSSKAAAGAAGSSAASWSAPGGKPGSAALASPVDLRSLLASAAAASAAAGGGAAASWLASQPQLSVTAFAVAQPGSPAAAAAGSAHLVAVAVAGGGLAVLGADAPSGAGGEPALRLLWASGGGAGAATARWGAHGLAVIRSA